MSHVTAICLYLMYMLMISITKFVKLTDTKSFRTSKVKTFMIKMKKNLWSLLTLMMVAMVSVGFASCGSNDDEEGGGSGVSGLYYYENGGGRTAYYFVNSNTVEIYGAMSQDRNDTWLGNKGTSFPLRKGWYYWEGNKHTYSYHIVGDVVFIGMDRVMTISGNTLIYDDMGVVLYKWN